MAKADAPNTAPTATVEELLGETGGPEWLLHIPPEAGVTLTPGASLPLTVIPGPPGSGITNILVFTLAPPP